MAVGRAYRLAAPFVWRCLSGSAVAPFPHPLIEPDVQIARIRLSDKTSRLRPRHVAPKPAQTYEPEVPVEVREWIGPAPSSPDFAATAAALACAPGAYNVVDGDPTAQSVWLPAFASVVGAPPPPRVSEEEALATFGPDTVYYATRLRGASNEKATRVEFSASPPGMVRPRSLRLSFGSDRRGGGAPRLPRHGRTPRPDPRFETAVEFRHFVGASAQFPRTDQERRQGSIWPSRRRRTAIGDSWRSMKGRSLE